MPPFPRLLAAVIDRIAYGVRAYSICGTRVRHLRYGRTPFAVRSGYGVNGALVLAVGVHNEGWSEGKKGAASPKGATDYSTGCEPCEPKGTYTLRVL